jgi:hypothetical protein
MLTDSHFLWKMTCVNTSWLIISTGLKNSLTNQNLFFTLFCFLCLTLLLYPNNYDGRCRCGCHHTPSISLSEFQRLQEKSPKFEWWISCTNSLLFTPGATSATFGDWEIEILSWQVSTLAIFFCPHCSPNPKYKILKKWKKIQMGQRTLYFPLNFYIWK